MSKSKLTTHSLNRILGWAKDRMADTNIRWTKTDTNVVHLLQQEIRRIAHENYLLQKNVPIIRGAKKIAKGEDQ